jgi:probable phosphoglycerate mutase
VSDDDAPGAAAPPLPETLLLLIRHAEQQTMRVFDSELSARGRRQAELLAGRLSRLPISAIVTSPLRRARQTADAVARALRLEPEVEADLEEVRIDDAARRSRYVESAISAVNPTEDDYARTAMAGVRLLPYATWGGEGIESSESARARGLAAVERVVAAHPHGVVAVVSHGGLINGVIGAWIGTERDMWFVPWHTGVSAVLCSGTARILLTLNDAGHVEGVEEMLALVCRTVRGGARL